MNKPNKTKRLWKSYVIIFLTIYSIHAICCVATYFPAFEAASDTVYQDNVIELMVSFFLMTLILQLLLVFIAFFVLMGVNEGEMYSKRTGLVGPLLPYIVCVAFLGLLLSYIDSIDVSLLVDVPLPPIDPEWEAINRQIDPCRYLAVSAVGILLLALFKGYRKHFMVLQQYYEERTLLNYQHLLDTEAADI